MRRLVDIFSQDLPIKLSRNDMPRYQVCGSKHWGKWQYYLETPRDQNRVIDLEVSKNVRTIEERPF